LKGTRLSDRSVTDLLIAWRAAERALEAATNPTRQAELAVLVASLADEYGRVVGVSDAVEQHQEASSPVR
jgi:hypothetical protein